MTNSVMTARLALLTSAQIESVEWHIRQGFGAQGIHLETGIRVALINAVFKKVWG